MVFDVKDKVALVTGSARGFGKEFAIRLLKRGAKVCISDLNETAGNETLEELKEKYGHENVIFSGCNVSKQSDWEATWNYVEKTFGKSIQLLINNAGVSPAFGWKMCLDVNIYGVMMGSFTARDRMGKTKGGLGGRVINIASMAGLVPGVTGFDGLGYPVSKWGTVAFTRSYSECSEPKPWEDDNIKAYALCPWFADTQLFNDSKGVNETEKKSREKLSTRFRVLTVEDVGDALEEAIDADDNGGIFMVFPDTPIIKFPELNKVAVGPAIIYAKLVALCFSQWKRVNGIYAVPFTILSIFAVFYVLVCIIF